MSAGYTEVCGCPGKVVCHWPHSLLVDFVLLNIVSIIMNKTMMIVRLRISVSIVLSRIEMMIAMMINMMVSLAVGGDIWACGGRRGGRGAGTPRHTSTIL